MNDETEVRRRVIMMSAPAAVDPGLILFAPCDETRPDDEFREVETSGNAEVSITVGEAQRQ